MSLLPRHIMSQAAHSRGDLNNETAEERMEREHYQRIINAYKFYRAHSLLRVQQTEKYFNDLPQHHKLMIQRYPDHLMKARSCIEHNYQVIKLIVSHTEQMFENYNINGDTNEIETNSKSLNKVSEFDMDKVKTTLKQFVRDWSVDGKAERDACYQPVLHEIKDRFPKSRCNPSSVHILVPGAGLGRLSNEIARMGYTCQGNEWSLFMLFASNFVLNKCRGVNLHTLYPWVHHWCNNKSSADQLRPIQFPDVDPSDLPPNTNFSMTAGDFLEVYTEPSCWDCVATVFFVDTAHNIIAYIETIWNILKPGGYWINFGPLLYHYADIKNETSIELPYDDVRSVIVQMGFEFLKEFTSVPSTYTCNTRSMLKYQYDSAFFVVRKPELR